MALYQLVFYVPERYTESVKAAIFSVGGGCVGSYDACSWQILGEGQFRPMKGSAPFIGPVGSLQTVPEHRVELVLEGRRKIAVIEALRQAHPYEEPAFSLWRLDDSVMLERE
ncbi:NGG1p interacting factor 3 protein, NIF3 [Teredinibacter purpureus]|jgi:Uncharacterized protein conserved in bacteria|uniref:NGG1p interacting factor 3 protein, NIF3 n=1 Tax=Teredinibacter purpureus TaxID=2731756 RepID=UPI0005F768E6|nr:NGG1p interacting factor 3 protein, NIF3 [Teredinibacter purpureus]